MLPIHGITQECGNRNALGVIHCTFLASGCCHSYLPFSHSSPPLSLLFPPLPPFSSLCSPILSSSLLLPAIRSLKLTLSVLLKHSLLYWLVAGPLAEPGVHSFQLVCLASVFQLYVPCAVMPAWLLCGFWSSELHYSYLHSKCFIKPWAVSQSFSCQGVLPALDFSPCFFCHSCWSH